MQPHSGAQANQAVYFAALQPGDTILGMSLPHGGHLTHGSPVNLAASGSTSSPTASTRGTELIDYDEVERARPREHKPKLIIAGASAYSRVIDWKRFKAIADEVGAMLMVDMAHYAGLIAGGVYPTPVGIADFVTTTTHKTLRGPRGGLILAEGGAREVINSAVFPGLQGGPLMHVIAAKAVAFGEALTPRLQDLPGARARQRARAREGAAGARLAHRLGRHRLPHVPGRPAREEDHRQGRRGGARQAHITVNKNAIPNDPEKPFVTSGIRIGCPAITTRGFTEIEAETARPPIADVLDAPPTTIARGATKPCGIPRSPSERGIEEEVSPVYARDRSRRRAPPLSSIR